MIVTVFLIEITADVLAHTDPDSGKDFIDVVLDQAEQKGTGRWMVQSALDLGVPITGIAEATFARSLSGHAEQRGMWTAGRWRASGVADASSVPIGTAQPDSDWLSEAAPAGQIQLVAALVAGVACMAAITRPRRGIVRIIDEISQQIPLRQNGFEPAGRASRGGRAGYQA